ncbi:MAG: alpha/beta hydrolase [Saccharospirillum sp.]|nr:alpha/beta hydrolase [Saccharospirillum sp.]
MHSFRLLNGNIEGLRWGQGRPVLALHGFLDNAMSFKPLSEHLKGVELWVIDIPGHGRSAPLDQGEGWTMMHWLPVLGRVLDELDWPEVTLLGHSMGAILAQMLAAVDPRVERVISLDALGPMSDTDEGNLDRLQEVYANRQGRVNRRRYYQSVEELWRVRTRGRFPLSLESARLMSSRGIGFNDQGWFHRYDPRLRDPGLWRFTESQVVALLQRIRCPVHLAVFLQSPLKLEEERWAHRQAAVAQLHRMDFEGGHHAHMETPEPMADWVNTILKAHGGQPSS